jgi:ABC-type branched-subunit amino acid transport system ATPase component
MSILKVENVTAGYTPESSILHGLSLELNEGEIVSIIGPNGAGKSTLLKAIFGLLKPTEGRILLKGEDIAGFPPFKIAQKGVSYVPQVENIFPSLTIEENLEMGAFIRNDDYTGTMDGVFSLFPVLKERRTHKAGHLSGGQRQMVAMGRALMLNPEILLLDEPSAGLAPIFVASIFEKIKEINATGVTILIVEQNAREALKLSHRGYVLAMGRNVLDDDSEALLANEEVGRLYLGG